MKNTSQGGLGGVAMNTPHSLQGWWVGEGREAPRRGNEGRDAQHSMVDVAGKDSK